jgi:propionyl-CoA carboxylase alpha chain
MIKASAGGGGKGMRIAWTDDEVREGFRRSQERGGVELRRRPHVHREIRRPSPRHIEIQVLGDRHGNCVYLNERECSIQRRNQKVIEEAPSPFLDPATRRAMGEQAVALAQAVGYFSAGTVEFIVDRTQLLFPRDEHPAAGRTPGDRTDHRDRSGRTDDPRRRRRSAAVCPGRHSAQWLGDRKPLYAEDPYRGFLPSTGRLTRYRPPHEGGGDAAHAVRNDTGVYEGGEISMYYDPMIAKLCTWAPDRDKALEEMRLALDSFEVEGIGHNLPFLSAVMDHPRFVSGDITTAFIAEEYPDGFAGADLPEKSLRELAAAAAAMWRVREIRAARVTGRLSNHEREVGSAFIVGLAGRAYPVTLHADPEGATVTFEDGHQHRVESEWYPGQTVARLEVDTDVMMTRIDPRPMGFRMRHRGADLDVRVMTPRHFDLSAHMKERTPPDTSNMLLCPMPGMLVSVDVAEGDAVYEGQPLCTVEAMKMENVLRAERKGVVTRINAAPGDSLAVDAVIMEFE